MYAFRGQKNGTLRTNGLININSYCTRLIKLAGWQLSRVAIGWMKIFPGENFQSGNYLGGKFPGGNFSGGCFPGWELSGWEFSGWEFSQVGGNCPGGTYPGWEFSSVEIFWVEIVRWESSGWKFYGWEFSCYPNKSFQV